MSDETPDSLIPYDEIVQEALRAVVGRVLGLVTVALLVSWGGWSAGRFTPPSPGCARR